MFLPSCSNQRPVLKGIREKGPREKGPGSIKFSSTRRIESSLAPYPSLDLSDSEWALIRPLFLLYVERETALHLEDTRGL